MLVVRHEFANDDEIVGHELRVAVNEGFGFVSFMVGIRLPTLVTSMLSLAIVIASMLSVPLTHLISKGALSIKMGMGEFEYLSLDK